MNKIKIEILNYKNIKKANITLDKKVVNIIGVNGVGKSNLLEAIKIIFDKRAVSNPGLMVNRNEVENFAKVVFSMNGLSEGMLESYKEYVFKKNEDENTDSYNRISELASDLNSLESVELNEENAKDVADQIERINKEIKELNREMKNNEKEFADFLTQNFSKNYPIFTIQVEFKEDENGNFTHYRSFRNSISKDYKDYDYWLIEWMEDCFDDQIASVVYEDNFSELVIKDRIILDKKNEPKIFKIFASFGFASIFEDDWNNIEDFRIRDLLSDASKKMTDYYFGDWEGDKIDIVMHLNNKAAKEISVELIKENNNQNSKIRMLPSELSQGYIWHFALKTLFIERKKKFLNFIIFDEPNNYLHISAQKSLAHFLSDYNNDNDFIIYSTHSPFMLGEDAKYVSFDENTNEWREYSRGEEIDYKNLNLAVLAAHREQVVEEIEKVNELLWDMEVQEIFKQISNRKFEEALTRAAALVEGEIYKILLAQKKYDSISDIVSSRKNKDLLISEIFEDIKTKNKENIKQGIKNIYTYIAAKRNSSSTAHPIQEVLKDEEIKSLCILAIGLKMELENILDTLNKDNK